MVTKLVMSPEKYFAYVVSNNSKDYIETISKTIADAKDDISNGVGAKGKIELNVEDGLSDIVEDLADYDVAEYIDWLKKIAISCETNTKDMKTDFGLKLDVNDVTLGEFNFVADVENQEFYMGVPYSSEYLYVSNDDGYTDYDEVTETLNTVLKALPDKADTQKLLTKYIEATVNSIEDVDESAETIEADGVSQKVTKLTVDLDGKLLTVRKCLCPLILPCGRI